MKSIAPIDARHEMAIALQDVIVKDMRADSRFIGIMHALRIPALIILIAISVVAGTWVFSENSDFAGQNLIAQIFQALTAGVIITGLTIAPAITEHASDGVKIFGRCVLVPLLMIWNTYTSVIYIGVAFVGAAENSTNISEKIDVLKSRVHSLEQERVQKIWRENHEAWRTGEGAGNIHNNPDLEKARKDLDEAMSRGETMAKVQGWVSDFIGVKTETLLMIFAIITAALQTFLQWYLSATMQNIRGEAIKTIDFGNSKFQKSPMTIEEGKAEMERFYINPKKKESEAENNSVKKGAEAIKDKKKELVKMVAKAAGKIKTGEIKPSTRALQQALKVGPQKAIAVQNELLKVGWIEKSGNSYAAAKNPLKKIS